MSAATELPGGFIREVLTAAAAVRRPLSVATVILVACTVSGVYALQQRDDEIVRYGGMGLIALGVVLAFAIVLVYVRRSTAQAVMSSETMRRAADDLAHRVFMPVDAHIRNFKSPEDQIDAFRSLAVNLCAEGDATFRPLRERMAERIRDNVQLYHKVDILLTE
jgi:pimeloyl-ACP methyl ester carboxylesterase